MEALHAVFIEMWTVTSAMAPYLLLGFFVAGLLHIFVPASFIERHLGQRGFSQITKAALLGIPIPLCSCGVIPVSASLREHGASKGATISFLASTPQTGVDSIFATYALLGGVFTIFRVAAAFVTGIISGTIVELLTGKKDEVPPAPAKACCANKKKGDAEPSRLKSLFQYGFVKLPGDIGLAVLLGLLFSGLLAAIVPDDFFAQKLGTGILPMLVMMVIGIPFYACSTASIPIAYALMLSGVTPGAALVFLITAPATNAATFTTIWRVMGRGSTIAYLGSIAACALASGLLLDLISVRVGVMAQMHEHAAHASPLSQVLAIGLILLLVSQVVLKRWRA